MEFDYNTDEIIFFREGELTVAKRKAYNLRKPRHEERDIWTVSWNLKQRQRKEGLRRTNRKRESYWWITETQ